MRYCEKMRPNSRDGGSNSDLRNRGSVLVLVIGLLTIVALLGGTFLLVSRMNRRTADALAQQTPAEAVAHSLLSQVAAKLKEDLHIGGSPESVYGASSPAVEWFMDYPADGVDAWLATARNAPDTPAAGQVTVGHITNGLTENFDGALTTDVVFTYSGGKWQPVGPSDNPRIPADTDGDSWADALLSPTGVTNAAGREYHAAVRVIDLSALINVNTAGTTSGTLPAYASPVHVDLAKYLTDTVTNPAGAGTTCWNNLNTARNSDPANLEQYYTQCAARLYSPDTSARLYLPFAIGDELYLRWGLADGSYQSSPLPFQIGRLFNALTYASGFRHCLTTFNCTRNLVRVAAAASSTAPSWNLPLVCHNNALADPPDPYAAANDPKQALYNAVRAAVGNDHQEAAHFVANLWAYLDGQDPAKPYAFTPHNETTYTAYGLKQDLVITEVYAYYRNMSVTEPSSNDEIWGYAIEIWNPTTEAVDLANYRLDGFGSPVAIVSVSTPLAADGRAVLYHWHDNGAGGEDQTLFGFPNPFPANWIEVNAIDFNGTSRTVQLLREYSGGIQVPVDEFTTAASGSDFNFDRPTNPNEIRQVVARRDDDAGRYRYNVKQYRSTESSTTNPDLAKKLGAPNELTADDFTQANLPLVYQGFNIPGRSSAGVVSIGEMMALYRVGPSAVAGAAPTKTSFSAFSAHLVHDGYADDLCRGRFELFNGVPAAPGALAPWGATCSLPYPAVPQACIFAELASRISPDSTRGDDAVLRARVYGRVNLNTARSETLRYLPWPTSLGPSSTAIRNNPANPSEDEVGAIVEYILAYRERRQANRDGNGGGIDPASPVDAGVNYSGLPGQGFQTPGELAIPLAQYVIDKGLAGDESDARYLEYRDALYAAVANLVTVNSDTYAVYLYVQIPDGEDSDSLPDYEARYLAVIDRSNCRTSADQPAVLLFAPIK